MRTHSKSLNPIGSGSEITGYVKGVTEYLEADTGADLTGFDVDSVIGAAWESVGPTGSGATNIWADMDIIPPGAKWVEFKIRNLADNTGGPNTYQYLHGRVTGSSAIVANATMISFNSLDTSGSSGTTGNMTIAKLPLDSSLRFDLYRNSSGTTLDCVIYLMGWGI